MFSPLAGGAQQPKPTKDTVALYDDSVAHVAPTLIGHQSFLRPKKDTTQCYFQIIKGVVNGQLMGEWFDGWVIKPKGDQFIFSTDDADEKYYEPIYLYHNKKVVTAKVINHY